MTSTAHGRDLDTLLRKLYADRGFDATHYRRSYIERRVATRLRALQVESYRAYEEALDRDRNEYDCLVNALTINVTEFFRDKPVWEFFERRIVPGLLDRKKQRKQRLLRVWSAGCSGGEEPYSIAMLLLSAVEHAGIDLTVSVHASDIDEESLERAREAKYPNKELHSVPARFRDECVQLDDGRFQVSRGIREHVKFRRLDLFADKPIAAVDVVFCRNVLIYFDRAQQERVFAKFHAALNRSSYLIIGKSEKLGGEAVRSFETLSSREKVYRRLE